MRIYNGHSWKGLITEMIIRGKDDPITPTFPGKVTRAKAKALRKRERQESKKFELE